MQPSHSVSRRTPCPASLARGSTGFAIWFAKRTGHLVKDSIKHLLLKSKAGASGGNVRRVLRHGCPKVPHVGSTPDEYVGFRSSVGGRDMAAYLCRRYSRARTILLEMSERFGLSHPIASDLEHRRATQWENLSQARASTQSH